MCQQDCLVKQGLATSKATTLLKMISKCRNGVTNFTELFMDFASHFASHNMFIKPAGMSHPYL